MLTITPKLDKITKHFPDLAIFQEPNYRSLILHWYKIPEKDYYYILDVLKDKNVKTDIDSLAFIYNYFSFVYRVSKTDYNNYAHVVYDSLRELQLLYAYIDGRGTFDKITLHNTKENKKFVIEAGKGPSEVQSLFEYAKDYLPYWKYAFELFRKLDLEDKSDFLLKKEKRK